MDNATKLRAIIKSLLVFFSINLRKSLMQPFNKKSSLSKKIRKFPLASLIPIFRLADTPSLLLLLKTLIILILFSNELQILLLLSFEQSLIKITSNFEAFCLKILFRHLFKYLSALYNGIIILIRTSVCLFNMLVNRYLIYVG